MTPIRIGGGVVDVDEIRVAYIKEDTSWNGERHVKNGKWKIHYSFGKENGWSSEVDSEEAGKALLSSIEHAKRGQRNMLKETAADFKAFIHDHRNIIFWLALAFLADHFFFAGAFRARLNACVERMIGRVEKQLESK